MLTDMQARCNGIGFRDCSLAPDVSTGTQALYRERKWRELESDAANADIAISRWQDTQIASPHEAVTPRGRYFIAISLKLTRAKLSRGNKIIFEGTMPVGSLYVAGPSRQLSAQFHAPCDFLHIHVSSTRFPIPLAQRPFETDGLNDLVLPRDAFAEQLARALTMPSGVADRRFAQCAGELLAIHLTRFISRRPKIHALSKWRLRRVEEYVDTHLCRKLTLADLGGIAGLSRMHFAAAFRVATGYSPRKYLMSWRIERAKSLMSNSEMSLVEIALAAGFRNQSHFSTTFKQIAGETPGRWRGFVKDDLMLAGSLPVRLGRSAA